jgi:hypothetical protein
MGSDRHVWLFLSATMILVGLLAPARASAHRIDVSVDLAGGKVIVAARYHDDTPVSDADVAVTDPEGSLLAEGTTDADGRFLFTVSTIPVHLNVVVETGDGHRGATTVSREELAGLLDGEEHGHAEHESSASEPTPDDDSSANHDDLHEIEAALTRVETELHEIAHELEHVRERDAGTSFDRVLAGVGFIFGLTGVAAYCLARRPTHG